MGEATLDPAVDQAVARQVVTSRRVRIIAMVTYAVALAAYSKLVGLPADLIQVTFWMWLGTIAWNIQAPWRVHLVFLRDWWPAVAVLQVYVYSRGITSHLGLPVHVSEPVVVDRWLGGGTIPTQGLQDSLCGDPCERSIPARWYDGGLTIVYYTHFIAAPLTALVLYLRNRLTWISFMRRYISLYFVGLLFYITYPMAPPWMASRDGYIEGNEIVRLTGRGWSIIGLEHFQQVLSRLGNQVAAMPSLHAATAALVALFAIWKLRTPLRFMFLLYPLAMGFMLVYYGEHYVVDIIAGYLVAGFVMWACANWERAGVLRRGAIAAHRSVLAIRGPEDERGADDPDLLDRLRRLPPLVVPGVLAILVIVAVMAKPYAAIPAGVLVIAFVGWVLREVWRDLTTSGRLVRWAFLAVMAALLAYQVLRLV